MRSPALLPLVASVALMSGLVFGAVLGYAAGERYGRCAGVCEATGGEAHPDTSGCWCEAFGIRKLVEVPGE